jgi:hypothetical protein
VTEIRLTVKEPDTAVSDAPPSTLGENRRTCWADPSSPDVVAELERPQAARVRLCVLCAGPLRPGQRVTRIQGSTIHARCSAVGR